MPAIEHDGVRYEQDRVRQRQADAGRGGWLTAFDAGSGARLWTVQIYANPYNEAAPVGSPPRWFAGMRLLPGQDKIEIDDTLGARFVVDLKSQSVKQTIDPFAARKPPPPDTRPKFD